MTQRLVSMQLLSRFHDEIERLFREALELVANTAAAGGWQPRLDIIESESSVLLVLEMPGVEAADLQVVVEGSHITVTGTKRARTPQGSDARFLCLEREHGRFERRVQLFWPVNGHRGRARLADGLLTLELPKVEEKRCRVRRLEIEDAHREPEDTLP